MLLQVKIFKKYISNKFSSFKFRRKVMVYTAEKDQVKYLVQNLLGKMIFFYVQTAAWPSYCCHKLLFMSLTNDFFII